MNSPYCFFGFELLFASISKSAHLICLKVVVLMEDKLFANSSRYAAYASWGVAQIAVCGHGWVKVITSFTVRKCSPSWLVFFEKLFSWSSEIAMAATLPRGFSRFPFKKGVHPSRNACSALVLTSGQFSNATIYAFFTVSRNTLC